MTTASILKKLRTDKGVSQQEVANYLKITRQAYSLYELGKRQPDAEMLLKLSEYFSASVDYLLGRGNVELEEYKKRFEAFAERHNREFRIRKLAEAFERLNNTGKDKVIEYAHDLLSSEKYRQEPSSTDTEQEE